MQYYAQHHDHDIGRGMIAFGGWEENVGDVTYK
jgi:hypothetical protein